MATTISGDVTLAAVNDVFTDYLATAETKLREAINMLNAQSGQPSQMQMIDLQYQVQTWTFFIQLTSTMQKEMADSFKGIIQKF